MILDGRVGIEKEMEKIKAELDELMGAAKREDERHEEICKGIDGRYKELCTILNALRLIKNYIEKKYKD